MVSMKGHPLPVPPGQKGLSLPELMVVVTIIGVLLSVSIDSGLREWRREKVNKVAIELVGWLENARRAGLRGDGCSISFVTGTLMDGGTLATASCMPRWPLVISTNNSAIRYSITATSTGFSFTPRGTRSPSSSDITISLRLSPDEGIGRCVAIQGLLGMVSPGKIVQGSCVLDQRF
jgi:prepilin-type N-terminal cleavage/methylation domain-containing protein